MMFISDYLSALRAQRLSSPQAVRQLNPLILASVGDVVYNLYVRTFIVAQHDFNAHALHVEGVSYVCAGAQAAAYCMLENELTEDESYIARRGRNTHPATVPKNASINDYRTATALEAVLGYLFLTGNETRIDEIMKKILSDREKKNEL